MLARFVSTLLSSGFRHLISFVWIKNYPSLNSDSRYQPCLLSVGQKQTKSTEWVCCTCKFVLSRLFVYKLLRSFIILMVLGDGETSLIHQFLFLLRILFPLKEKKTGELFSSVYHLFWFTGSYVILILSLWLKISFATFYNLPITWIV